jgi:hypothetical protein
MADDETYYSDGREYHKATDKPVWPARHREHPRSLPTVADVLCAQYLSKAQFDALVVAIERELGVGPSDPIDISDPTVRNVLRSAIRRLEGTNQAAPAHAARIGGQDQPEGPILDPPPAPPRKTSSCAQAATGAARPANAGRLGGLGEDPYVRLLLETLDSLERKTRPSGGSTSADGKDLAAFEALECAGQLVAYVAGWAIDHQVGLASEDLQFVPLQPSGTREHPEYLRQKANVNSHRHERAGGAETGANIDPLVLRRSLTNLVRTNCGGWPKWLAQTTAGALEALEFGKVHDVFQRVRDGKKGGLTARKLQLQAISMVAFRRSAYGKTREDALAEVAEGLDTEEDTISSWEKRLKKEMPLEVARTVSFARNHGSYVYDFNEKKRLGLPTDGEDSAKRHGAPYDTEALMQLRRKLQSAKKR